jgi:N-acetylglutamate synthase-like GNAT family acetyltransferase
MQPITEAYHDYTITTDRRLLQPVKVHEWLTNESYWAKNISYDVFKVAFDNSFVIGILYQDKQVAFARLVTDYATFAYLADVYVINEHRGRSLSKKMMELLMNLDWVKTLRRVCLVTLDAHDLYKQYGFTPVEFPDRYLEITRPDIYKTGA